MTSRAPMGRAWPARGWGAFTGTPARIAAIAILMALCVALLLAAGRPHFVLVHAFYFPVLLAAHWFYARGGIATGMLAGVLASSYVVGAATPAEQAEYAWVFRSVFYATIGGSAGVFRRLLVERSQGLEASVKALTRTYARTLRSLVQLLEHHDEETSSHCERVALNSRTVGEALGLPPRDLETLYWAGYLHDVGKLASPAKMLLKEGPLEPEEYEIMKRHAAIGGDVIMTISPSFVDMASAVRAHHERWDGTGYPDGLAGERVPLFGRILSVVDAFEAMTSDRPYRKAMPAEAARAVLQAEAGRQFDPRIVETFLDLLEQGRLHLEYVDGKRTGMTLPLAFSTEFLTR